jgi:nitric oxide dioxygenase
MLSDTSRPVIEATAGVVSQRMDLISKDFYRRLFEAHPSLLDGMFSRSNQLEGGQSRALSASIVAFAGHLLQNPDTLPETTLSRIAHKHASLGVTPEQYDVVYEHLFAAIAADLGDAVTPEVASAWTEVYWLMANALMAIEKDLYGATVNPKLWTEWRVASASPAGAAARTLRFEPTDDSPIAHARAGQYIGVRIPVSDGLRQVRQYSLSAEIGEARVITVKRDDGGEVSPILHDDIIVGDIVELSNPYGEVVLKEDDGPVVFASAGIGCTPIAAMLKSLADSGSQRTVTVLHAERRMENWALRDQMRADVSRLSDARMEMWLSEESTEHTNDGRMTLEGSDFGPDTSIYICGPVPFMRSIRSEAIARGVAPERVHYEVFGPNLWQAAA